MSVTKSPNDIASIKVEQFLERNGIDQSEWKDSGCDWEELQRIAADHRAHFGTLNDAAEFFGKTIQRFGGVHSVRWRVKDVEHLLKKIIRKCVAEKEQEDGKYKCVTVDNYFETITDLIGVRALHLFKEDYRGIHRELLSTWTPLEGEQTAYVRGGEEQSEFAAGLQQAGFVVKAHGAGYRSLHYVFEIKPTLRAIRAEVQVRTIFEEGWSEIDHTIRYPDFNDNPMVLYCLQILNRMAGSADEMGGFVRGLTQMLDKQAAEFATAIEERDDARAKREDALEKVSESIRQMAELKESNSEFRALAETFQRQVQVLQEREAAASAISPFQISVYGGTGHNAGGVGTSWASPNMVHNGGGLMGGLGNQTSPFAPLDPAAIAAVAESMSGMRGIPVSQLWKPDAPTPPKKKGGGD
ncbi:RelA/SpoT domain-containing protein [Paraburkholderia fungorum]